MSAEMQHIIEQIEAGAASSLDLGQFLSREIDEWMVDHKRRWMLDGQRYYSGESDVLRRERQVLGEDGKLQRVDNLANHRLVHPFLRKLVDQKVGYLLSQPMTVQTERTTYADLLSELFDKAFMRMMQSLGKEALNKGLSWLHVYYDDQGKLSFKRIPSEEIIPYWKDAAHTKLDAVVRMYDIEVYEGSLKTIVTKVEFWDATGVRRYERHANELVPDVQLGEYSPHMVFTDGGGNQQPLNWERVPFVCFKYNDEELPLLKFVKSLMDDYDAQMSLLADNLEDLPNSIYVLRDYDGQNLGEFRRNIATYRAVKVHENGNVDTIDLKMDIAAYKEHMAMLRKDIYELGRGVDTQSEKFGNSPSGIALKFLYSDLDMDANILETEFQASLEQVRWFIDRHIVNTTGQDFTAEAVEFVFNRNMLVNETDTIANVKNSAGLLSEETLLANHPWVDDVQEELNRLEAQRQAQTDALALNGQAQADTQALNTSGNPLDVNAIAQGAPS